ncbi:hypothetical protein JQ604_18375 [Bradyrhizobium jicamae]|uniref:hypothetical protein n=1 Tax=Bradyrhizobium jicamae TaxID=280332 RepID=UPI001BA9A695|nr:hypothetical protein [Bradyrhizobium jicamae]MBR0754155.1 hypothetical protein [Bradyrhizobium jicamae]
MTSFENGQPAATRALTDGDLDSVNGGCFGVPVETRGGGIIYVSPTTGYPNPNGGPLPYFPINSFGRPFPL